MSYASGLPILAPASTNNLTSVLFRSTFYNRNPGVPMFLKTTNTVNPDGSTTTTTTPLSDLNCHCIDPTKDLVLNPAAWTNPVAGQWGAASPYYNDYRYQRRPSESMSLGRVFQFGTEAHPMKLTVRMNLTNIFNRTYLQNPSSPPPPGTGGPAPSTATATNKTTGLTTNGFGFINYNTGPFLPARQGTLEMRFSF